MRYLAAFSLTFPKLVLISSLVFTNALVEL